MLEDLVEIVRVTEADELCDLYHRLIGFREVAHSAVHSYRVDIIYRGLSHTVLKDLGEVVLAYVDHSGEKLDRHLLLKMLVDVFNDRAQTKYVMIDHTVKLVL